MKKFVCAFFTCLLIFISSSKATQWLSETEPFGVRGTDKRLPAYIAQVKDEHKLVDINEGKAIPTLNKMGIMVKAVNPFAQEFINFACANSSLPALSIGEGMGNVARELLKKNVRVIANDMYSPHFSYLYEYVCQDEDIRQNKLGNLYLKAGKFPYEVALPEGSVIAIYFGRVLHFMTGQEIEDSFREAYKLLPEGGKIFGRASTPFQCHLGFFEKIYGARVQNGDPWPGICTDMKKGWPTSYQNLPEFMNLLDIDPLRRALEQAGFKVEKLDYVPINDPNFKKEGREGVGFVAVKEEKSSAF